VAEALCCAVLCCAVLCCAVMVSPHRTSTDPPRNPQPQASHVYHELVRGRPNPQRARLLAAVGPRLEGVRGDGYVCLRGAADVGGQVRDLTRRHAVV